MFKIEFTDAELYEMGDAVSPALQELIAKGDPNDYEAKYGSASNMVSILRKIWTARSPDSLPTWLPEMEAQVAALRAKNANSPKAARAVAEFKAGEAMLSSGLKFKIDEQADADGIRRFTID